MTRPLAGDRGRLVVPGQPALPYRLRPFLGLVAVAGTSRVHTTWPGSSGGNLDARRMGVGTTWWLPVREDGAFVSVGDPHHAQGDGEIAGTSASVAWSALSAAADLQVTQAVNLTCGTLMLISRELTG